MPAESASGHFHAVRFYEDDTSLCRIVSGFVAEGLALDQPALVIATQPHIDAVVKNLTAAAIDVDRLRKSGELLLLDARQTLATFMVNGQPDPDFFKASATSSLEQLARGRAKTIRAYGEMVDVLWKDGMSAAAIKLEMLWNRLANTPRLLAALRLRDGQLLQGRVDRRCVPSSHPCRVRQRRNRPRVVSADPTRPTATGTAQTLQAPSWLRCDRRARTRDSSRLLVRRAPRCDRDRL